MTTYQMVFYRIGQASAFVLAIGCCWWAERQMSDVGWPNFPQFETGLTIPPGVKGIAVYISPKDVEFGRYLMWVIIVSGALMVIFGRAEQDVEPTEAAASTGILVRIARRPRTIA